MYNLLIIILPILLILVFFCLSTIKYILQRLHISLLMTKMKNDKNGETPKKYAVINSWLQNANKKNMILSRRRRTPDSKSMSFKDINPCKKMALLIPKGRESEENICQVLGGHLCCVDMKKIKIPMINENAVEFYASNGTHLIPGESYCVFKQPPLSLGDGFRCDEIWGFWQYSPVLEMWICKSKVPGVYNAANDTFDSCQQVDHMGVLLFDDKPILDIKKKFTPDYFYSENNQRRFKCRCSKGFLFVPELGRGACFKDPCLSSLPQNAAAPGYDFQTGMCRCGSYFKNIFNNFTQPCTACPKNPIYDSENNTVTIFIKCYNDTQQENYDNNQTDNKFGLFPCVLDEDKARGCMEAKIKIKAVSHSSNQNDSESFEKKIFSW